MKSNSDHVLRSYNSEETAQWEDVDRNVLSLSLLLLFSFFFLKDK